MQSPGAIRKKLSGLENFSCLFVIDMTIAIIYLINTFGPTSIRSLVSLGALGAMAPTVFESVSASNHAFWLIWLQFHQFSREKIWKLLVIW